MRRKFVLQRKTESCIIVQGNVIISRESKESRERNILRVQVSKSRMVRNLETQLKEYRTSKIH